MAIICPTRRDFVVDRNHQLSFRTIKFLESLCEKVNELDDAVTVLQTPAKTGKLLLQDGFSILLQNGTDSILLQGGP